VESISSTWFGWLLWMLGFDFGRIPSDAKSVEFTWLNMPTSWGVFVLIGVVLAFGFGVFYFYIREIDTCPRRMKLILAGVRFAVLFLLVIVFLSPALTYKQERTREPYVVVMRDASQSMNTKDRYLDDGAAKVVATASGQSIDALRDSKPTRTELLNELLARKNYEFVRLMQERGKVRIVRRRLAANTYLAPSLVRLVNDRTVEVR